MRNTKKLSCGFPFLTRMPGFDLPSRSLGPVFRRFYRVIVWIYFWNLMISGEIPTSSTRTSSGETVSGLHLAHQYCSACHLFPEPEQLDKRTWGGQVFRKMAPYLGVAQLHYENRPDGAQLKESTLFPPTPLLNSEEWQAIQSYYINASPEVALPQPDRVPIVNHLEGFQVVPMTNRARPALATMVQIDSRSHQVLVGDAGREALMFYGANGHLEREMALHGTCVGLTLDGDRTLATLIGHVFPSDLPDGRVIAVPSDFGGNAPVTVLDHLQRPTDLLVADLNGDGRKDLLVSCFGNYLGRLVWFEQMPDGHYDQHVLLERSGAIEACLCDVNHDGRPDFMVLMAQGDEGLFLFTNQGAGQFQVRCLARFHPAFGSTHFELTDMNSDGFPDIVLTNGDNGEYPSPFKRYHGIRIFSNDGAWNFSESWFYPLNGAFKVVVGDFDGDGDPDLAAISFFPNYLQSPEEAFVFLRNDGSRGFSAQSCPEAQWGRWLTLDAGDIDGDGSPDLVLGSFVQGPAGIPIPPEVMASWHTNGVQGLILHNIYPKPVAHP